MSSSSEPSTESNEDGSEANSYVGSAFSSRHDGSVASASVASTQAADSSNDDDGISRPSTECDLIHLLQCSLALSK